MRITDFSFLASILWSTLLLGGVYALRRWYCIKSGFTLWVMIGLYLLGMTRAFFSAELQCSITLNDPYIYAWLCGIFGKLLRADLIDMAGVKLSIGEGLFFLWGIVACILLSRHLFCYHKAQAQIQKYASMCSTQAYAAFRTVQEKFKKQKRQLICVPL